jgi:hypothetical protein
VGMARAEAARARVTNAYFILLKLGVMVLIVLEGGRLGWK